MRGESVVVEAAAADRSQQRAAVDEVAVFDRNTVGVPETYLAVTADVSDDGSVRDALAAVIERYGRVDIVVNVATLGGGHQLTTCHRSFVEQPEEGCGGRVDCCFCHALHAATLWPSRPGFRVIRGAISSTVHCPCPTVR